MARIGSRVFIIHDEILAKKVKENQATTFKTITLPHPKYGFATSYLLIDSNILEIQCVKRETSSWFIGDSVEEDGSLFIATRIDPIFIALPFILGEIKFKDDQTPRFQALNNSLTSSEYKDVVLLRELLTEKELLSICDQKVFNDSKIYRINKEKIINWLKQKVLRVATRLDSSSLAPHSKTHQSPGDSPPLLKNAIGLISEYLPSSVFDLLLSIYKYTREDLNPSKKVVSKWDPSPVISGDLDTRKTPEESKKRKSPASSSNTTPKKQSTPAKKGKPRSKKEVSTKGMASISTFFGAKPPNQSLKKK